MAKRQSNTPRNITRIDGEGKVHAEGKSLTPLCNLKGNENHSWVATDELVDCARCVKLSEKKSDERERLEYATRVSESQEDGAQHVHPMEDARPEEPFYSPEALRDLDVMAKGEPPVIPAETPVVAESGETVTVPVDYDDESKGRRELDASKGERIISEDDMTALLKRVRARLADEKPLNPDQWAEVVTQTVFDDFSVTLHEPKNGSALESEIPPLPAGVHPHTWELAHQGNTEGARNYHMRQAKAQEAEYLAHNEENGYDVLELEKPPF
jgi:hypothetical protein